MTLVQPSTPAPEAPPDPTRDALRVYVAGASAEIGRARGVIAALRARGLEIVHDWPAVIDAHGGRANTGLTDDERAAAAHECWAAACNCDVLLLLVPHATTVGAWVELGAALTTSALTIASGATDDMRGTIFTAMCAPLFERAPDSLGVVTDKDRRAAQERADDDAIAWIAGYAHARSMREAAK